MKIKIGCSDKFAKISLGSILLYFTLVSSILAIEKDKTNYAECTLDGKSSVLDLVRFDPNNPAYDKMLRLDYDVRVNLSLKYNYYGIYTYRFEISQNQESIAEAEVQIEPVTGRTSLVNTLEVPILTLKTSVNDLQNKRHPIVCKLFEKKP